MIRSGLLVVAILAAPVWADPFDDVRLKRHAMLTGGAGIDYSLPQIHARLANIESSARGSWERLQKDPGRADLAGATSSAQITSAWSRLKSMALAWATPGQNLYGDAALLADVRSAAAWLEENRYNARVPKEYDNWWDWEIGTPLQLGDLLVLLHGQLTPEETGKYAAAIDRFDSDPRVMAGTIVSTGANRVWKCMGAVLRAIAVKDAAKLQLASDSLGAVFPYVTSGDGFYQDGSFIQHGRFPYTGGYGNAFISQIADILHLLAGSPWDVHDPARDNVYRWVFDSFQPLIYRGAMMDMVRGREISRAGSGDHGAGHSTAAGILRLSQLAPAGPAAKMQSMVKEWLVNDTSRDWSAGVPLDEVMPLSRLLADSRIPARGELLGSWIFGGMDRVVHLRPGWGFGVAMHSSRINNYESINQENLRGWHSGDGMTYLYTSDLTQFSDGFWPTVDPQRLPGTTVVAGSTPRPNQVGGSPIAGGATVDGYSAAMMLMRPTGGQLNAKKSWFLLDDEVIALGSDIGSTTPDQHVETIVENRLLTGDPEFTVAEDGKWACLGDNLGYFFPSGGRWKSARVDRQGSWREINAGGSPAAILRRYQTIWFDHGATPDRASYAYALLPGKNSAAVAAYAAVPGFRIVENSVQAHAVSKPALGLRAVNFWTDDQKTSDGITSDRIASALVIEGAGVIRIAVADPTQANAGVIHIEIDRAATGVMEKDDAISIDQMAPALRLTVNVANARGRSFKLKCATR
ncbi:MAG TPA: polysaccharide lyase 8 family protein [Bryobacteraceae bacterium]|nr:polysaccharide lyase 8 family protein [Bryobacteraceae bacterium]